MRPRILAVAVSILAAFVATNAAADCLPVAPAAKGESEKDLASLLCRTFRDLSATKAGVSFVTRGLVLQVYFDDLEVAEAFGKPELAEKGVGGVFDTIPELWTEEGRTPPKTMFFAVWSNDPTDRKPRVVWTRKGPGSPLTVAKTDGLALTR